MSMYPELDALDLPGLQRAFDAPPPDGDAHAAAWLLEVAGQLAACGAEGIAFLRDRAASADAEQRRAAMFGLASGPVEDPSLDALLVAALDDPAALVVAEAIDGLRYRDVTTATDRIEALLSHESGFVRGAVLRFVARCLPNRALPVLAAAATDPDAVVRENVADELDDLDDDRAVPILRALATDPHSSVREAAETALLHLTGHSA